MLAEGTFRAINGPVEVNGQRASALRFADPRVHALRHALLLFRLQPQGFRNAELRLHLAALSGRRENEPGPGAMSYQLRRLRLHGMIERIPKSQRYRVTTMGLRVALFFTRSCSRVFRPGPAFALPGHRVVDAPLKRCFDNIETEIHVWIHVWAEKAKLAA